MNEFKKIFPAKTNLVNGENSNLLCHLELLVLGRKIHIAELLVPKLRTDK
jgi:hypothetical protein